MTPSVRRLLLGGRLSPASLFRGGVNGIWLSPSDISAQWSDTAATTPATVGGAVARSNDKSGNGNNASQATAGFRPLLRNPADSIYTFDFDGSDDRFSIAALTAAANTGKKFSFIVGLRAIPAGVSAASLMGQYDTTGNQRSWVLQRVANTKTLVLTASVNGTSTSQTSASPGTDEAVVSVISDGTSIRFYHGLTLVDTLAIAPFGSTAPLTFATVGTSFADIEIAEAVFFQGVELSSSQRIAIIRYAAQKAGVIL